MYGLQQSARGDRDAAAWDVRRRELGSAREAYEKLLGD